MGSVLARSGDRLRKRFADLDLPFALRVTRVASKSSASASIPDGEISGVPGRDGVLARDALRLCVGVPGREPIWKAVARLRAPNDRLPNPWEADLIWERLGR